MGACHKAIGEKVGTDGPRRYLSDLSDLFVVKVAMLQRKGGENGLARTGGIISLGDQRREGKIKVKRDARVAWGVVVIVELRERNGRRCSLLPIPSTYVTGLEVPKSVS